MVPKNQMVSHQERSFSKKEEERRRKKTNNGEGSLPKEKVSWIFKFLEHQMEKGENEMWEERGGAAGRNKGEEEGERAEIKMRKFRVKACLKEREKLGFAFSQKT